MSIFPFNFFLNKLVDIFFQAIYMFGFGIPLFIDSDDHTHPLKWNLWVIHRLVLTAVYGFILFMYHSKWRERLPGKFVWHMQIVTVVSYQFHDCLNLVFFFFFFKLSAARPAFYNYIAIMFSMNALALLACALTGSGAGFGFW